jgi:hypothetical protein
MRASQRHVSSSRTRGSHWWPLTVGSIFSRRVRRATVAAAVIDSVVEYVRTRPQLDPVRFALARRLVDLACTAPVSGGERSGGGRLQHCFPTLPHGRRIQTGDVTDPYAQPNSEQSSPKAF